MGILEAFISKSFYYTVDAPVTFIRGVGLGACIGLVMFVAPSNFVEKQQNKHPYYYYHRQYRRVTPIEDCNVDDYVCVYEAEMQYKRDRLVDQQIIIQLQELLGECSVREGPNAKVACQPLLEEYDVAATNYDTKYGGLGAAGNVTRCMMKQKYRLLDERRSAKEAVLSSN